jgi:hypothetical protein
MAKWEVTEPCGMLEKLQKKFGDDKVKSYIMRSRWKASIQKTLRTMDLSR